MLFIPIKKTEQRLMISYNNGAGETRLRRPNCSFGLEKGWPTPLIFFNWSKPITRAMSKTGTSVGVGAFCQQTNVWVSGFWSARAYVFVVVAGEEVGKAAIDIYLGRRRKRTRSGFADKRWKEELLVCK